MWASSSTPSISSSHLTLSSSNQKAWSNFTNSSSFSHSRSFLSSRASPTNTSTTLTTARSTHTRNTTSAMYSNNIVNEHRVKVSVRVRPPFKDEIDAAPSFYLTTNIPSKVNQDDLACVQLGKPGSSKQREFLFDHCFGPSTDQEEIFNVIAKPVVEDVLKGGNGTVFAYGQTGTGKTYTMGILQTVDSRDAKSKGVVPRALETIFASAVEHDVTMSFMQIYCETIQDLLATGGDAEVDSNNLQIREDPRKGFYVKVSSS